MDAGAFSDDNVVKVSSKFVCVVADGRRQEHNKVYSQYGVRGTPTVIFLGPDGKEIGKMSQRDPGPVAQEMQDILKKCTVSIPWQGDISAAIESGKGESKPVVVLFANDKKDSQKILESFGDMSLGAFVDKCLFVKVEFTKDSDDAKKYKVTSAPAVRILDPTQEKPEEKPMSSMDGTKSPSSLKSALEQAVKKLSKKDEKSK